MLDGLELVQGEGGIDDSVLGGAVDVTRVAVAGHSAGGSTAFNALHDRRVKTAIGWAPVGPSKAPADKPTMIIGAALDSGITPVDLKKLYASFPEPKRRIEIGNAGHNTFTDVCVVIRGGGGLIEFARDNNLVAPGLLELAYNGCEKDDLAPEDFWPVVQHFTVAQMRDVFGPDPSPAGLDDAIADAWDPVDVTYEHQP